MRKFAVATVLRMIKSISKLSSVSGYDVREGKKVENEIPLDSPQIEILHGGRDSDEITEKWNQRYDETVRKERQGRNAEIRDVNVSASKPKDRRKEVKEDPKDNAVLAVELLFYFSREHHPKLCTKRFFRRVIRYLEKEFGEENILLVARHGDSATEHIHVIVIPITKDRRLCASKWFGNNKRKKAFQDRYFSEVGEPLGLDRGIPNRSTRKFSRARFYGMVNRAFDVLVEMDREEFLSKNPSEAFECAQDQLFMQQALSAKLQIENKRLEEANLRQAHRISKLEDLKAAKELTSQAEAERRVAENHRQDISQFQQLLRFRDRTASDLKAERDFEEKQKEAALAKLRAAEERTLNAAADLQRLSRLRRNEVENLEETIELERRAHEDELRAVERGFMDNAVERDKALKAEREREADSRAKLELIKEELEFLCTVRESVTSDEILASLIELGLVLEIDESARDIGRRRGPDRGDN